jgi:hypothetical protein
MAWTVTGVAARANASPRRASSYRRRPPAWRAEKAGGTWSNVPTNEASASSSAFRDAATGIGAPIASPVRSSVVVAKPRRTVAR